MTDRELRGMVDKGLAMLPTVEGPPDFGKAFAPLDADNLRAWGDCVSADPGYAASRLFPDVAPNLAQNAVYAIMRWSALKAKALEERFYYRTDEALVLEADCKNIRLSLPIWARW